MKTACQATLARELPALANARFGRKRQFVNGALRAEAAGRRREILKRKSAGRGAGIIVCEYSSIHRRRMRGPKPRYQYSGDSNLTVYWSQLYATPRSSAKRVSTLGELVLPDVYCSSRIASARIGQL